jgi:hypothetical protein
MIQMQNLPGLIIINGAGIVDAGHPGLSLLWMPTQVSDCTMPHENRKATVSCHLPHCHHHVNCKFNTTAYTCE